MGQTPPTEHIQFIDTIGRGLYVRCSWTVDRYQHQIGWVMDGVEYVALESCEGTPDDDWPLSPPIQQLSTQTIDGNPALLGVGMAGRSHWSASFLLQQTEFIELIVELACLVPPMPSGQPVQLQTPTSTYRVSELCRIENAIASRGQQSIALQKTGLSDLVVHSIFSSSHFRIPATDERQLVIEPVMNDANKTTQWSFRIDTQQFDEFPNPSFE